jgi:hypothetical protein
MSEKDINRWQATIAPRDKAPQPWTVKSGGSWDMLDVQPIPDAMLSELAQRYQYAGTPWNCRSLPLSPNDREYMYLLYFSMQGLVARMRKSDALAAELLEALMALYAVAHVECDEDYGAVTNAAAAIAKATGAA